MDDLAVYKGFKRVSADTWECKLCEAAGVEHFKIEPNQRGRRLNVGQIKQRLGVAIRKHMAEKHPSEAIR
jgi:hypothetical protein